MFKIYILAVIVQVLLHEQLRCQPCSKHLFIFAVKIVSVKILFNEGSGKCTPSRNF